MAVNKNALIRYKTIDKCLQNRQRKWTLTDLIEECSDALYEYEGKDTYVSKRTVQLDIQNMRSDKFGYNAPIIVVDRKYYKYEEEKYSITNIPISSQDLEMLAESVAFLKQFKGFTHFDALGGVIQKLEDHVHSNQTSTRPVIEFEKNENLKGLGYLDELYQTIIQKKTIEITYKSFKARLESVFVFHAYLLKEFRNRWFVVGIRDKQEHLVNLALDRIISLKISDVDYSYNYNYDLENYYSKAIGVSINSDLITDNIVLFVYNKHAPYVQTKPFHPTQKLIKKDIFGITISLDIQHNFELEKEILGLGDGIRVISPSSLKRRIHERLIYAAESYQTEISEKGLFSMSKKMTHKGSAIINQVFSKREIKKIHQQLNNYFKKQDKIGLIQENLLEEIPNLKSILFNINFTKIIVNLNAKFIRCVYYKKRPDQQFKNEWFQELLDNQFSIKIHLKETTKNTFFLNVILGSHNKRFSKKEMELIIENSSSYESFVREGGIHLVNNLTIRKWQSKHLYLNCEIIELFYEI